MTVSPRTPGRPGPSPSAPCGAHGLRTSRVRTAAAAPPPRPAGPAAAARAGPGAAAQGFPPALATAKASNTLPGPTADAVRRHEPPRPSSGFDAPRLASMRRRATVRAAPCAANAAVEPLLSLKPSAAAAGHHSRRPRRIGSPSAAARPVRRGARWPGPASRSAAETPRHTCLPALKRPRRWTARSRTAGPSRAGIGGVEGPCRRRGRPPRAFFAAARRAGVLAVQPGRPSPPREPCAEPGPKKAWLLA